MTPELKAQLAHMLNESIGEILKTACDYVACGLNPLDAIAKSFSDCAGDCRERMAEDGPRRAA